MSAVGALRKALEVLGELNWSGRERQAAAASALRLFFQVETNLLHGTTAEAPGDLEQLYGLLIRASGTKISRPTAAAAFLQEAGLGDYRSRLSRLSTRRKIASHPDADFLPELRHALEGLAPEALRAAGERFRGFHDGPKAEQRNGNGKESKRA